MTNESIEFVIPTIPIAQPRQRHRVIGEFVQNDTPKTHPVNAYKASLQHAAREVWPGPSLEGPLAVWCLFVMPRTKNQIWKRKPMPEGSKYSAEL